MKIYIFLLAIVLLNIFFETSYSTLKIATIKLDTRKVSFFVCFIFILIIGLMRNEHLGVDVENYRNYFLRFYPSKDIKFFLLNFKYDIGYVLLNKLVRLFTSNFRILENIVYCISFGIFSYIIYKNSKFPALSFLVYIGFGFLGTNLCILRQSIACSICFLSFDFLKKNDKLVYFMLILLAISFHKTAIFFILSYIITEISRKNIMLIKKNIFILISVLGSMYIVPHLYKFYSNDYSSTYVSGSGYKLLLFYIVVSLILSTIIYNKNLKSEIKDYECSFGSIYLQIGALSFSLFSRVTRYFELSYTLSVANISYRSKYSKFYVFIFSLIFSIMYIYGLIADGCEIVPYAFFFA
ncbi:MULTISPECIES: EpsG family protein [Anaerococcus]|uniref:EpsG family protein n=1 Tax=Anaerococcus TaxID=165779 RepID=UPI002432107A|nr:MULTISPECIES: EpsG family protein [Anaerococcus]MDD7766761.1 EpsG family protein [Anaerococcus vaginalis]MDY6127901.1 EpsG family protein [Anaerococcus sp.]